jgi:hypothetical protein
MNNITDLFPIAQLVVVGPEFFQLAQCFQAWVRGICENSAGILGWVMGGKID